LTTKLREWRNVETKDKKYIFEHFAAATIKDAFSSQWVSLRTETQNFLLNSAFNGFLLDTIVFFNHVLKAKEES